MVAGHERQSVGACHLCALPLAAAEYPGRQGGSLPRHRVQVVVVDPVAAVQHGEDVVDLVGEVRRDRLGLLQNRHLRAQLVGDDGPDVERRRHDDAADVTPLRWQFALGLRLRVVGRLLGRLTASLAGPAHAEVDAARVERIEHCEALDDRRCGGVAQLHRARADVDGFGGRRDLADQHRWRRAGNRDEVVLGDPVPLESPLFGVLREVDGVVQRGRGVVALADRREVEDRQGHGHVGSTLA